MKPKLFTREPREKEGKEIEAGLRSKDSFVLRRSQIISFSIEGFSVSAIAQKVGYHRNTVRKVIKTYNDKGTVVLKKGSRRPHRIYRAFDQERAGRLKALMHRSPREFGRDSNLWTLELLAEVSFEQGLTEKKVSDETIRLTIRHMGVRWKRAKHWLTSPDPHYKHKKTTRLAYTEGQTT